MAQDATVRMCEQGCGKPAEVYGGGPLAGDWAGAYCEACLPQGFGVWQRLKKDA